VVKAGVVQPVVALKPKPQQQCMYLDVPVPRPPPLSLLHINSTHHHHKTPTQGDCIKAMCHITTAIIGAGVLGLPHAVSMLGWLGGIVSLVLFFAVTMWCSFMLSDMYEYDGVKHGTYGDAVVNILGA